MTPAFAPGTLRPRLREVSDRALARGILQPIETRETVISEGGVDFPVRVAENLVRKEKTARSESAPTNPFLPPDPDLVVGDVSDTHLAVLNKFPVVTEHLLLVTRKFASQTSLLTLADFEAWCRCLAEFPSLGFYNSGRIAGASQPHKHLQQVPLPLSPSCPVLPLQAWIASGGFPYRIARIPFPSAVSLAFASSSAAQVAHDGYREALTALGIESDEQGEIAAPHNVLLNREWLVIVPRSRAEFQGIPINGMGIAGSFFTRTDEEVGTIQELGPRRILQEVTGP